MKRPFIIFGLPRSRTFWLSRFLSYRDWHCGHDELRHVRSMDDVDAWFSQPCIGTVETAGAPWWRLAQKYQTRVVVVRRPVADVTTSLMRCHPFDAVLLDRRLRYLDAKLNQIEARVPDVLSVRFEDLADETVCAQVFERCLPYAHDPQWWKTADAMNLQVSVPALLRYMDAYRPQLDRLTKVAKAQAIANMSHWMAMPTDGMAIQQESFETFLRDGQKLISEHLMQVGETPDAWWGKNLPLWRLLEQIGCLQVTTARCNGRMFGYLLATIGPSLEHDSRLQAVHTAFYASPEVRGLGIKLQLASIEALRGRRISEVFFRAGIRGDGPRMGPLFRRIGAEDYGQFYRLDLRRAA